MWNSLVVLHSSPARPEDKERDNFLSWHTCQRSLYIGDSRISVIQSIHFLSGYEIYTGYTAYKFLLEIVSGLHSKLYGESEIQSQFSARFSPGSPGIQGNLGAYCIKLRDDILEQSRKLRSIFFTGHGRQTYGGIADSLLPDSDSVVLWGTGSLAESMITHLRKKDRNLTIYGRNPDRLNYLKNKFSVQAIIKKEELPKKFHLVIAAPISNDSWLQIATKGSHVLDFRGETSWDNSLSLYKYTSFVEILSAIEKTESKIAHIRPKIEDFIQTMVKEREERQYHMPHGWEDLVCSNI